VGLALVCVGTALLVAAGADLAVAVSVLLLAVVGASVLGYAAGLAAAVAGFATLNYYFTPPQHSFAIDRTDDLVALVVFVAIAAIVGTGAARLNEVRTRAQRGEREALLRLTPIYQLAAGADPGTVLESAARELVALFDLAWCEIATDDGRYRAVDGRSETQTLELACTRSFRLELGLGRALSSGELNAIEALGASLATTLEQIHFDAEAREHRFRSELARSRAGFLTAVTHDLRTPLAAIKAGTGTLLVGDSPLSDTERRKVLQVAHDEAARLERLVTNVLELTRIRGGALRPEPVAVSAADLVRVAAQRLRHFTDQRTICMEFDPELPTLWVDPAMLEHAVVNLLENALRYSPGGLPIEIRAAQMADEQELRVVDHGPGVAVEDRDRMFDEFVRLDPKTASSGTGLGLAIVRAFVEVTGGRVWYEETPGGGATFVVVLPTVPGKVVS
jgi:two-component system, OmpR family, sensor histidine kinase KdpD